MAFSHCATNNVFYMLALHHSRNPFKNPINLLQFVLQQYCLCYSFSVSVVGYPLEPELSVGTSVEYHGTCWISLGHCDRITGVSHGNSPPESWSSKLCTNPVHVVMWLITKCRQVLLLWFSVCMPSSADWSHASRWGQSQRHRDDWGRADDGCSGIGCTTTANTRSTGTWAAIHDSSCMYLGKTFILALSLSFPVSGGSHCPNPFQVAPEVERVGCEGVSWPGVPPGVIVGRTLEHQMLDRLVGAVAVWADGRVPALDPVKVSCYQWGMISAYLCVVGCSDCEAFNLWRSTGKPLPKSNINSFFSLQA